MSRSKKSRSLKGKLGKTGTKEMMKEQKKARKAASPSRFDAKKVKQRKVQAQRKLERLGMAPEAEVPVAKVRPKRFTFTTAKPSQEAELSKAESQDNEQLSKEELLAALTEQN